MALSTQVALAAVVSEPASQARMLRTRSSSSCRHPRPTDQGSPSSVSSANRDMQCARGPCAARGSTLDSDLELSGPCWRSPGWRRSQLGAGIPGLDAHDPTPLSVSAARSDWSRLTKLCLLRVVPRTRGPCAARRGVLELFILVLSTLAARPAVVWELA